MGLGRRLGTNSECFADAGVQQTLLQLLLKILSSYDRQTTSYWHHGRCAANFAPPYCIAAKRRYTLSFNIGLHHTH